MNPERIATLVAPPMALLSRIVAPLGYVLEASSRLLLHLFSSGAREIAVTDDEVKAIIAEGVEEGVIAPKEQEMIIGVMRLADWRVRALMTPRRELAWIDIEDNPAEIERRIRATPYSRVLVKEISGEEHAGTAILGINGAQTVTREVGPPYPGGTNL